ncbi:lipocalin-like domain-containing protein [Plantibacter sp. YIM 135347]|uniref:lipocalin-like domain-containing protein n=1 Tax=Plantibacter sp. YIM 135347 TaxID=3423919 RepID=UPI003D344073
MSNQPLAVTAGTPADYQRLGLAPDHIAAWEDGARTDNRKGTYEWWYFDAHLEDGAKLVVVFMNKDLTSPNHPLDPIIRVNLDLADGRSFTKIVHFDPDQWSASTDGADVRIGDNRFSGDLHTYRITANVEGLAVDVTLTGTVPSWRPETGYMLFGEDRAKEFSWLPSVPQGRVEATYSIDGESHTTSGVGYHDHNWGNVGLMDIVHDWYWARGEAGPYTVIASYITAHERYGYEAIPIFMLAKDGVIIADDSHEVTFATDGVYTDEHTGKPVARVTSYTYDDGTDRYVVSFTRERDLARDRMIDGVTGLKRLAAKAVRFDGAYLRFTGPCSVQHFRGDALVDEYSQPAIWELMYFGHAR